MLVLKYFLKVATTFCNLFIYNTNNKPQILPNLLFFHISRCVISLMSTTTVVQIYAIEYFAWL